MGEEAAATTTAEATAVAGRTHLLLICFPGQGHVNPMLRLAKRIAAKGLLVTFSSTSDVGAKLTASSGVAAGGDGVSYGRGRIRFEFLEDHFDGKEFDDLMRHLETTGPKAFAELLRRQEEAGRPVACVVGNPFIPWAIDVAAGAGIPSAVLWVQSFAVFSLYYHHVHGLVEFPPEDDPDARVTLPGLPALSVADVPSFLFPSNPFKLLTEAILKQFRTIDKASWVLVNSFSELERDVVAALPSVTPPPPPLIPVGPLVELEQQEEDAAVRGDMIKAANDCVGWLDAQAPRSVVYASVGSVCHGPAWAALVGRGPRRQEEGLIQDLGSTKGQQQLQERGSKKSSRQSRLPSSPLLFSPNPSSPSSQSLIANPFLSFQFLQRCI